MRVLRGSLGSAARILSILACICTPVASAQSLSGRVTGEVTDTQGGVLPGVTIVIESLEEHELARTVSDAAGRFSVDSVPAGPVRIVFALDGFETAVVSVPVSAGSSVSVVERLKLAKMLQEVIVVGKSPPPPPPPLPRYEPPAAPVVTPVPQHELESVCRPTKPGATAGPFGTIRSHRYAFGRELYSKGDELVVNGGTRNGLEVGRNLIVVRYFRSNSKGAKTAEMGEHTAGLVQIVAATESSARAVVMHACNELRPGDLLAAFMPVYVRTPEPPGTPSYEDAARILHADAGQLLGAPRRLLVIDRGSDQGFEPGRRLTLFRRTDLAALAADVIESGAKRKVVGEAIVVAVRPNSSTIRVVSATDAIEFGDWAAPQRASQR